MMSSGAASGTEHRALLADSVADFAARGTDLARVRRLRGTNAEYDRAVWKKMAELSWLGILVPERYGGLGLGLAEMAIVARGLARVMVPEPLTATAVLAATVLAAAENDTLKEEQLPRLVAGELLPALAWQEQAKRGELLGQDVSMLKIWSMESWQRLTDLLIETGAEEGVIPGVRDIAGVEADFLSPFYYSRPATLYGGSSEIQRNILAKYVLKLPS